MTQTPRRALLSVSDKSGIEDFARGLVDLGFQILSTGGTARVLEEAGIPVTPVSEVTGHPEILEGRVKTLHPAIHGPLLARRDRAGDLAQLAELDYGLIDVVAVNLYPFRETVAGGGVPVPRAMEQVDIGGPTMIRAAAKNHGGVLVVTDPADYGRVLDALVSGADGGAEGSAPGEALLRRELAVKVFRHVSAYDAAVAAYLESAPRVGDEAEAGAKAVSAGPLPEVLGGGWQRHSTLRYGENPDQSAGFYTRPEETPAGIASLHQHQGRELSYNNLLDLDGALLSLAPFALSPDPAVCIVKHTTPCGMAVGSTVEAAYRKALATDPMSAFGSIIATNRTVDAPAAAAMVELFVECLVAPDVTDEALEILSGKVNLRVLTFPDSGGEPGARTPGVREKALEAFDAATADAAARRAARFLAAHGRRPDPELVRSIYGGLLVQTPPTLPFYGVVDPVWRVVTERTPTEEERMDLAFAWAAVFGVKSNAILLARGGQTLGIGAGQMSRVDSSRVAVRKAADAGLSLEGSSLASDAFFPFRDGVDAAAEAGVRALIQPGGSKRDSEVVEAANEHGMAMIFTGRRLFRH
ncbi:MAG: bifunctional phosphoribosylaminoimidazolecarboxamide formyltransferase/IMP cyclohydrolase PurH [Gemmatimonadales bacterium]|nr:MAG: bifunctional phosphoribosylaminoimidazolecarboxamide formyltransferase/IMP cyclohydrolase PurH [Gemmatimonadales bacterium]